MGCFGFKCDGCGEDRDNEYGDECWDSNVQIEIPLKNNTVIYVDAKYDMYGRSLITLNETDILTFYNYVDSDYFEFWDDVQFSFIHTGIWCPKCRESSLNTHEKINVELLYNALEYQVNHSESTKEYQ
jgi:hypothetical protein